MIMEVEETSKVLVNKKTANANQKNGIRTTVNDKLRLQSYTNSRVRFGAAWNPGAHDLFKQKRNSDHLDVEQSDYQSAKRPKVRKATQLVEPAEHCLR